MYLPQRIRRSYGCDGICVPSTNEEGIPGCYGTDGETKVHGTCVCSMPAVTADGRETQVQISEDRCQDYVDRTPGTQEESKDVDAMKAAGPVLGDPASRGCPYGTSRGPVDTRGRCLHFTWSGE